MPINLDAHLVETASKIAVTTNEYGDINYGSTTPSACLYRDISSLEHNNNRDTVNIDGLLWFDSTEVVAKGDIYYHTDEGYLKIIRVVKAKRLVVDNTLQFIKCEVAKQRQIS